MRMLLRRRYDLPLDRDGAARLVPWIVALMSYLAAMALAGGVALGVLAWQWSEGVSSAITVLLPPLADGVTAGGVAAGADDPRISQARQALADLPGVGKVEPLDPAQVARRLEPWLGAGAGVSDLPLPRLLIVRVTGQQRPDTAAMRQRMDKVAAGAVVDDHGVWRAEIARLALRIMALSGFAVGLIGLAGAAVVVFAVRSGLAIHRETIEVLHLIGAHDDYIARQFQNHTARLAFVGGLISLVLLVLTEIFVYQAALSLDPSLLPRLDLKPWQWMLFGAAPGLAVFVGMMSIAGATAKRTVQRALARLV
jgi:cell division transport system permease protein